MAAILLQNHTITQVEIDEELTGDDSGPESYSSAPLYAVGSDVQVKSEDTRVRWRKPHLRCPGYIFGCIGTVEKYVGTGMTARYRSNINDTQCIVLIMSRTIRGPFSPCLPRERSPPAPLRC